MVEWTGISPVSVICQFWKNFFNFINKLLMFSFKKKQTSEAVAASSVHSNSSMPEKKSRQFNVNLRVALVAAALVIIVIGSLGAAGYFYNEYKKISQKTMVPADELADVLEKISRIIELPQGETPTLATVSDVSKLSGQKFFEKAQNGDKVLIYTQASTAYLFRPVTGKVINVSQLNIQNESQKTLSTDEIPVTPSEQISDTATGQSVAGVTDESPIAQEEAVEQMPVKVTAALYNGSTKVGVTNTLEEEIVSQFENVEVVAKEKAVKNDYQGNLVVDLSGKNAELVKNIADNFNGIVGTLPDGEIAPVGADILIIVGNKK